MDFDSYVSAAKRTINSDLDERDRLLDAAAGLAEESAEVLGLVRKRTFQQREIPREKLVEELGDVLWCLAVTADTLGISLNDLAAANIEKLTARHPGGFTKPRGPEGWARSEKE